MSLDAHEKPPDVLRELFKRYQKVSQDALHNDPDIVDFRRGLSDSQQMEFHHFPWHKMNSTNALFQSFRGADGLEISHEDVIADAQLNAYSSVAFPGRHAFRADVFCYI